MKAEGAERIGPGRRLGLGILRPAADQRGADRVGQRDRAPRAVTKVPGVDDLDGPHVRRRRRDRAALQPVGIVEQPGDRKPAHPLVGTPADAQDAVIDPKLLDRHRPGARTRRGAQRATWPRPSTLRTARLPIGTSIADVRYSGYRDDKAEFHQKPTPSTSEYIVTGTASTSTQPADPVSAHASSERRSNRRPNIPL